MNSKKIVFPAFLLIAIVQIYIPAKMIFESENVLGKGSEYKFKTAPIDPSDPFRGKYITLQYQENVVEVQNEKDWTNGETIFVLLSTDADGFAKIKSVSKEIPADTPDYLNVKISYVSSDSSNKLIIAYPFDRFYMEESKAYEAELIYRQSQADTSQITYAKVIINNGNAVLKDVLINGTSIKELVNTKQIK